MDDGDENDESERGWQRRNANMMWPVLRHGYIKEQGLLCMEPAGTFVKSETNGNGEMGHASHPKSIGPFDYRLQGWRQSQSPPIPFRNVYKPVLPSIRIFLHFLTAMSAATITLSYTLRSPHSHTAFSTTTLFLSLIILSTAYYLLIICFLYLPAGFVPAMIMR